MSQRASSSSQLPVVNTIWIGAELGPVQVACLKSFLQCGHRVILHCYDRPNDLPGGVELADAASLLPKTSMVRYKNGSVAVFSNFLRYEILKRGLGLYADCDVFCLEPIEDSDYIFGWESSLSINNAILKLPADCLVLTQLRALKQKSCALPWLKSKRKWRRKIVRSIEELPRGTTGPAALTYYAKHFGIERFARPVD